MSNARPWDQLLEFLNGWATAVEVGPGRIEVGMDQPDGSKRVVEIVMTPGEWASMVGSVWGEFEIPAGKVRQGLQDMRGDDRFLIFHLYEFVASSTPRLPADPVALQLNELARQQPEGIGHWYVRNRDGTVEGFDPNPS